MKKCKDCNQNKKLSSFYKDRKGVRSDCKECHNAKNKIWHENFKLKNPNVYIHQKTKIRAKKNNIPFDITVEDIIIPETCPVLGISLKAGEKKVCSNSPSIDRIKPELGYVKGNIQIISFRANTLKNNATIEELQKVLEHLKKIV